MTRVASSWATVAALAASVALAPAAPTPAGAAVEIVASRAGFTPATVPLRRGETVHVVLTSKDVEHCFAIDELRIEKRIVPGRPTRFDLTAERAGTFPFYCCLESGAAAERERGELVVSE